MAIPVVLDLDDPRWTGLVESSPEATPFHAPAWAQLLADCYRFRALAFGLEAHGHLLAGIPILEVRRLRQKRRWVALPFTDALAPLGTPASVEAMTVALNRHRETEHLQSVEIRANVPGGTCTLQGHGHVLQLGPDVDELASRFSKSQVQRNIARATREGVHVRVADRQEDLVDTFYELHLHTRRRQGVPIQPRRFFSLFWERLLARGLGYQLVAEMNGRALASAIFLSWNGTVVYKYGASDQRAWRFRPNHALFWEAIRRASAEGMHRLDFGRTEAGNEGLRAFKAGWGTTEQPLVYTTLGDAPSGRQSGAPASALAHVIRHSPAWVCRALGETLYRWAA